MRQLLMPSLMTAIFLSLPIGCKSVEERTLPAPVVHTPLDHDPTDEVTLARWWSNGDYLLRLDADAAYVMHRGGSRFSPPVERGRWFQQSYAVLWLEPYGGRRRDPLRVRITRIEGELSLIVPRLEPMFALDGPPAGPEDRVIGMWSGSIGKLQLDSDMRYTFTPTQGSLQRGDWRLIDSSITLRPDLPKATAPQLQLREVEGQIQLHGRNGTLTRAN